MSPRPSLDLAHGPATILRAGSLPAKRSRELLPDEPSLLDSRSSVMSEILVVCTGNICRSPMAEGFLRAALVERLGEAAPVVTSAGTAGWDGSGAMDESIRAAQERGVDIRAHLARRLHGARCSTTPT